MNVLCECVINNNNVWMDKRNIKFKGLYKIMTFDEQTRVFLDHFYALLTIL